MLGPDGLVADAVKAHSELKRGLLEGYLKFWTINVQGKRGREAPSLDIYDLFASTGYCVDEHDKDHHWKGTALVAADFMFEYRTKRPCHLYLNSWSNSDAERVAHDDALRTRLAQYPWERWTSRPLRIENREFNDALEHALATHAKRAQYASLWILDPYSASTLSWNSLCRIMDARGSWQDSLTGETRWRRPELFLNFMTVALQRNPDPARIANVLGIEADEWIQIRDEYEASGEDILDALIDTYSSRIEQHYGRPPHVEIVQSAHGNPVSVLMLIVEQNAPFYLIRKYLPAFFGDWKLQTWKPQAKRSRALQKLQRGLGRPASLDDFA